mmetsp:Transcript_62150/g.156920  ORF Transcript_62150/g.156920 Transcript_62150/m.156920 type:complete len:206 (-) Transcript_62150:94-711(-)
MSWPSVPSPVRPNISSGFSSGVVRILSTIAKTFSEAFFRGVLTWSGAPWRLAWVPCSLTFRFFSAGSALGASTAVRGAAGGALIGSGASSSSSPAATSSRIRRPTGPLALMADRIASSTTESKIFSSCQAWTIRATSLFSCSDGAFRNVFTTKDCTRSESSALNRPVLSISRMSSNKWTAWMSSHGKHCFAQSHNTCDSCLACFA